MLSRDDSRPLYITGGQGGSGGQGHPLGTGGPGGAGLGPTVHITAHNLHATFTSKETFQLGSIQASRISNHCPPPSRIFQGRRNILDKMHYFFTSDMGNQHIYVLYGLGGAGKTQIALKFINESSSRFSDTFFIDMSTIATIDTGLKNIAVAKGSGDSPQDGLLWLACRVEEWLLVFDNADDPSINLNDFIPQCNHGNIIITSRNPELHVYGSHSPVSDMEEEDAVGLLLKSAVQAATPGTIQIATEIVKALHCFPLAIVQAGAFISKSQNLGGYLALYTENQAQLLSEKPSQSHDHYTWTVYTTWQMSFDRLRPVAAMFLQLCSFLHYNGISEEIFSYASRCMHPPSDPPEKELQEPLELLLHFLGSTGEWDSLRFLHVITEVKAYSLISFDAGNKLFSIHPLVHAWSRTTVRNPEGYMSTMGFILGMATSKRPRWGTQLASLVLYPHLELAVQSNAEIALLFWSEYVPIFWEAGKYRQSEKFLKEVLEKQKQRLGDNHPDTLGPMSNLAWTYSRLGEHQKAEELNLAVLEKQKQVLGDNHPGTLGTMGNLASTYSDLGEHQKAKELYHTVLEKQKQVLGDNHPDTLRTMGNLARTYSDLGEHQKARELKVTVLEKRKQVLGNNHPDTLGTMGSLASTYSGLGEYRKAKELNLIVLEKRKQVLDDNHLDTLGTMGNLASTYSNLGEHQKAKELKVTVLEKQKQVLGDNHPDTLGTMGNLANTYSDLGEHQKAKELKVTVLEKKKQVLGDNHPDTLRTMGNLAQTYSDLGEHQKAKQLNLTVLEKRKQVLGDNHPDTLCTMGNLAKTYSDLGAHQEAKELNLTVLENLKQVLGDNHPHTLRTMGNLALTYSNLGEHHKAKELKDILLEQHKQFPSPTHSPSLHVFPPPPLPSPLSQAPSSLPPHKLRRGLKKQNASAATVPAPASEMKATKKCDTHPPWK
ncbi:hypothetical protein B0H14DRAFT_1686358 [Mycena olivaceomarginata]|nr:hypothetical protein B0H14DRAFT_1686358 [Mycena olivaceomarginata]